VSHQEPDVEEAFCQLITGAFGAEQRHFLDHAGLDESIQLTADLAGFQTCVFGESATLGRIPVFGESTDNHLLLFGRAFEDQLQVIDQQYRATAGESGGIEESFKCSTGCDRVVFG
jgi:hypothetical protein